MKIEMSVKFSPENFGSRGFVVELGPEDIGYKQPDNDVDFHTILNKLMFEGAKAVHLFLFKEGWEDKEKVIERLKVYKDNG